MGRQSRRFFFSLGLNYSLRLGLPVQGLVVQVVRPQRCECVLVHRQAVVHVLHMHWQYSTHFSHSAMLLVEGDASVEVQRRRPVIYPSHYGATLEIEGTLLHGSVRLLPLKIFNFLSALLLRTLTHGH